MVARKLAVRIEDMIEAATRELILESLRKALFPFAKFLIFLGCSYRDFAHVAKLAFLDAAAEHLARNGSISKSGLAETSGVTKREISSLLRKPHHNVSLKYRRSPASEVLNQWSTSPQYSKANGEPMSLAISGNEFSLQGVLSRIDAEWSIDELVRELREAGSIEFLEKENKVRLKRRAQIHNGLTASSVYHFERTMYTIGTTLVSNMTAGGDDSKLLEQASYTYGLRPLSLPKFLLLTKSSSESFIELVDEWISANEDRSLKLGGSYVTGVGVYAFHALDRPKRFEDVQL